MAWTWRLEDSGGAEVEPAGGVAEAFPSQADAESWVGEVWPELFASGVHQVVLFEGGRKVYGPMGLSAD